MTIKTRQVGVSIEKYGLEWCFFESSLELWKQQRINTRNAWWTRRDSLLLCVKN